MNKKNQFIIMLQVIIIGGFAKIMSLLTKIIMTRELGLEAMSLFSLVNPLILLLLTLSSLSLQNAIGSLISKNPEKKIHILKNALIITIAISIFLMISLLLLSKFISNCLFNNSNIYPSIIASIFIIPLTSISSIIKGYFLGIGELKLSSFSQIFEECGRLLFLIIILTLLTNLDPSIKSSIAIFSLCVGEVFQITYLLVFYKNTNISKFKRFFKIKTISENYYSDILKISIPMTLSRLVGSLTYFLEPIIFTMIMGTLGFDNATIAIHYGILNSYALPLLLLPGFISLTLSNLLIPNLGKNIRLNNYKACYKYLIKITFICLFIGIFISIFFYFTSDYLTTLIYGQNYGSDIIKKYTFYFIIYYIETPLITAMTIFNLNKKAFSSTVISSIFRILFMFYFIPMYKIDGLCISIIVSTYIDVFLNLIHIMIFFKRNNIVPIFFNK